MKTFAIFPSIAIFLFSLTLFRVVGKGFGIVATLISTLVACLLVIYSRQIFELLFYSNFISVIIVMPCLTYLGYSFLSKKSGVAFRIKIIGIAVAAALITGALFAATMFFALMNNPMHPVGE